MCRFVSNCLMSMLALLACTGIIYEASATTYAYVMPTIPGDRTIYRITFDELPCIEPFGTPPFFYSAVSALCLSADKRIIYVFHTSGDLLEWNPVTGEHQVLNYRERVSPGVPGLGTGYFSSDVKQSSSGRYFLVESYGAGGVPGLGYALLDATSGRMLRYILGAGSMLTSACFSSDERYVFAVHQRAVAKLSIQDESEDRMEWLTAPSRGGYFSGGAHCIGNTMYLATRFEDGSTGAWKYLVEAVSPDGERKTVVDGVPGRPFDVLPLGNVQAFSDKGTVTIIYPDTGKTEVIRAERRAILDAIPPDTEERVYAEGLLSCPPKEHPDLARFDYAAITPDGRYALFGLNTRSARKKGFFVPYDLKRHAWCKGLMVGHVGEGGSTWPFFINEAGQL